MITKIIQPTRQAARSTVRNLKARGKIAIIIDRGSVFKGSERWEVAVNATVNPSYKGKIVKSGGKTINSGFDIRKVRTGVKGFDVYFDGEFLLRRETKINAYSDAVALAHKVRLDTSSLNYK